MCGKTYNTEDSIGSNESSHLSVVFVLYIVSAISSHFKPLGICAWQNFFFFVSVCFLRYLLIDKCTQHSMYSKFLSPGCACICSFKWPFCEQHSLHSLQLNGFSILSDTLHTDSTSKVLKASHQLSRLSRPCLTNSAIFAPKTGLHHI